MFTHRRKNIGEAKVGLTKGPLNNNYDNGCCFYGPLWPVDEPECNSYWFFAIWRG